MVSSCCALNCTNRHTKDSQKTFHRFPVKDEKLLKKWTKAVRRKNWKPSSTSRLCSDHFEEGCFLKHGKLLKESIPSIFTYRIEKEKMMRRTLVKKDDPNKQARISSPFEDEKDQRSPDVEPENLTDKDTTTSYCEPKITGNIDEGAASSSSSKFPSYTEYITQKGGTASSSSSKFPSYTEYITQKGEEALEAEIEEQKALFEKFYSQHLRLSFRFCKLANFQSNMSKPCALYEASQTATPYQMAFLTSQVTNKDLEEHERIWTDKMKKISIGLYLVSPAAYSFLKKALLLPTKEEIEAWIEKGYPNEAATSDETGPDGEKHQEAQAYLDQIAIENFLSTLL